MRFLYNVTGLTRVTLDWCLSSLFPAFITCLLLISCASNKAGEKGSIISDPTPFFEEVKERIAKKDFDEARRILGDIRAWDASHEYSAQVQLRLGDTYYEEKRYDEAIAEYRKFLDLHTHHKYASYVQYRIAMSYFNRIEGVDTGASLAQQALEEFQNLRTTYPRNPFMDITEKRIKKCKSILADYEFYVGRFYMKKGSPMSAVQRFEYMLRQYPSSNHESEALYYLGLSYRDLGKTEKALEVLETLINKYPNIKLSAEARALVATLSQ